MTATVTEWDAVADYVAELVYEGQTDKAIAARLGRESRDPIRFDYAEATRFAALIRAKVAW